MSFPSLDSIETGRSVPNPQTSICKQLNQDANLVYEVQKRLTFLRKELAEMDSLKWLSQAELLQKFNQTTTVVVFLICTYNLISNPTSYLNCIAAPIAMGACCLKFYKQSESFNSLAIKREMHNKDFLQSGYDAFRDEKNVLESNLRDFRSLSVAFGANPKYKKILMAFYYVMFSEHMTEVIVSD